MSPGLQTDNQHSQGVFGLMSKSVLLLAWLTAMPVVASSPRQSADEWRRLSGTNSPPPQVFVGTREVRFYFPTDDHAIGFVARLEPGRLPTTGYQVSSALLHLKKRLPPVDPNDHWRRPVLIAGAEWREISTNVMAGLTPVTPGHAKYYRGLLGDRILYRNTLGRPAVALLGQPPPAVVVDHRYSVEETLRLLAITAEPLLRRRYPHDSLFVIMLHQVRSPQPLLLDLQRRRCIWLSSAGLYEPVEADFPLAPTAKGLSALVFESNGLALVKNPVSSLARLGNLIVQSAKGLVRLPWPKPSGPVPPLAHNEGMDLRQWDNWLDKHTRTARSSGSTRLLIDGESFFPRFQTAIANANDHVKIHVFIFDTDDVAIEVANQLKEKSSRVVVNVLNDRLATMAAGRIPPLTPPPKPYVPPKSMPHYLKTDSNVKVRQFYNAFCSYDHSKVYLVDGTNAWLGGMNIGREYRSEWHDLMVELQGPIVSKLEYDYQLDWAHASGLGDLAYLHALMTVPKPTELAPTNSEWMKLRLLPTRTIAKPFAKAVLHSFRNAQKYIYAENPYLFDKRVMVELVRARQRGVDVRVILPHVNDSQAGARAELVAANYLVRNGVRVFYYPGMTHVKAVLVDGWACVGSGNLNEFSFGITLEQNVATSDPRFADRLKHDLFEQDFSRCYELSEPVSVEWMDFVAGALLEAL